ncbi:hypothetical protein BDV09DRAFT_162293 [Aspergillus tetrazonus]
MGRSGTWTFDFYQADCRVPPSRVPGSTWFQVKYDYYSIGIVLLQIGSWKPSAPLSTASKPQRSQVRESACLSVRTENGV